MLKEQKEYMEKIKKMKAWNGNIYKEVESLKGNQKEILELKSRTQTKNSLESQRHIWSEERITLLEVIGQWKVLNLRNRKKKDWRKVNKA